MLASRMKNLTPYVPGEQPKDGEYIKLNTNENPYPPAPEISSYLSSIDVSKLRLYPDPASEHLRTAIAEAEGLSSANIFVGNGSDEVLSFVFYAFFDDKQGPLLFPEHSYSFYPVYASYYDIPTKKIALNGDFSINIEDFLKGGSTGIIFPNPNAPTGIGLPLSDIRKLLQNYRRDRLVAVDEAYIAFGGESAASLVDEFDNLLIIRTFSKSSSLAGLRIGYAIGNPALIAALNTVKDSFNSYPLDRIAQKCGELSVKNADYEKKTVALIVEQREWFSAEIRKLGWEVLPSQANFVFARKSGTGGREIYDFLRDRRILVRHFDKDGIRDFVRITIGTEAEMQELLRAIRQMN